MKRPSPQVMLIPGFEQFIRDCKSKKRLSISGNPLSNGTIKNYGYTLALLVEFERGYKPLRILILNKASVRKLNSEKNYWKNFFTRFNAFLYNEKGYYDAYISMVYKIIKIFFNYLQKDKGFSIGNYHKLFKIPVTLRTPTTLLPDQLKYLISDSEFEQRLSPTLKRTKDIFVFGCTVGLRISDLMNLQRKNIIESGEEVWLSIYTQKTGTPIKIPLPKYTREILKRLQKGNRKYLIPRISLVNLNKHIKQLIYEAGWRYTVPKFFVKQGRLKELKNKEGKSCQFYEHISSHTMRRTAITTLLIMGVPEIMVRKISGHAPGSTEFYKYVMIADQYLGKSILSAYDKLLDESNVIERKELVTYSV